MNEIIKLNPGEILVLRTCDPDGTSYGGFQWPMIGPVEATDWEPTDKCGHGLHGFPWGAGDSSLADQSGKWWVVRVSTEPGNYRHGAGELIGKCKFRRGEVVLGGAKRCDAVALVARYAPPNTAINWANQEAGYGSTQTAGDGSTQTAGYGSTQTAGDRSTQTAGGWPTQTAGDRSTQTAGYGSTQKAGDGSTQTAGDMSTQKAGDGSTQTAGDRSTQTAGKDSVQVGRWYDGEKWRVACRIVSDAEANKPYRFDQGKWTEVKTKVK